MADEPRVEYIADQLKSLSVSSSSAPRLQVGGLCLAQYSLDDQWYRASVQRVISSDPIDPQYSVIFLDFGNQDRVRGKSVRAIDSALAAVPAQAHCCSLAYLKVNYLTGTSFGTLYTAVTTHLEELSVVGQDVEQHALLPFMILDDACWTLAADLVTTFVINWKLYCKVGTLVFVALECILP